MEITRSRLCDDRRRVGKVLLFVLEIDDLYAGSQLPHLTGRRSQLQGIESCPFQEGQRARAVPGGWNARAHAGNSGCHPRRARCGTNSLASAAPMSRSAEGRGGRRGFRTGWYSNPWRMPGQAEQGAVPTEFRSSLGVRDDLPRSLRPCQAVDAAFSALPRRLAHPASLPGEHTGRTAKHHPHPVRRAGRSGLLPRAHPSIEAEKTFFARDGRSRDIHIRPSPGGSCPRTNARVPCK